MVDFAYMRGDRVPEQKRVKNLPTVRVSEDLEMGLMRLAARQDRTLSEYIRQVLTRHVFGHGASTVGGSEPEDNQNRASQRSASGGDSGFGGGYS